MNFDEYKEMMKDEPYTETLKYYQAVLWLHPQELPLGVVSIGDEYPAVIKVPRRALNRYENKVPVIAISREAFAGHDKVTDIILPPTIERFTMGAFAGCSELKRITIPKTIKMIKEGTFDECVNLEDVYYEGTLEEWKAIDIIHQKHEIEFGPEIPGTPVNRVKSEHLLHIPGNDAILTCNIHCCCALSDLEQNQGFDPASAGKDITKF